MGSQELPMLTNRDKALDEDAERWREGAMTQGMGMEEKPCWLHNYARGQCSLGSIDAQWEAPLRSAELKFCTNLKVWRGASREEPWFILNMWGPELGCHDCSSYKATCQGSLKKEASLPINRFLLRTERIKPQQLRKSPKRKRGIPSNVQCSYIFISFFLEIIYNSTLPTPLGKYLL